ncbi:chromosome segregation protein SMC [Lacticaseibacillus pabuli]|uniref:Chromosome partition protein Smc n=1 Tax=Lacticaseibacillus pabuli TaxID=3025672 RepID=A0ABY7WXK1_9LACO|nr:chromosome segregation protein SMC [Lacticaseibacillus sp. KACC 23028]WDF83692.1 chromosome segregation protein SMC [Lacticaseibacillus sp. KACC 23028]
MQLKSLTLNGFKSFADKTTIEFNHGLTGIVGPNGSGKSNITEAIRWALGEQSAKSLRGERMGDVIFAGTAARPPLSRAEVTMVFDNTDQYLRDSPAEVTVTRRLFRDGESDFLLNGKTVRLRDVIELFMDSGLGRDSFAFISQGRVEAIFNSKPEDRRGIFEEAAGVLKYKQQKVRAQAQLQETSDNLSRVHDIVHELEGRMTPLAEQASIAQDYQQQNKDYRVKHQQLLALEIRDLAAEQTDTQTHAKVTKRELEEINALIKQLEAQSDQATKADAALQKQLEQLNDDFVVKSTQREHLSGQENVSSERAQNAVTTLADLRERLAKAQADHKLATEKVNQLEEKNAALQANVKVLAAKVQSGSGSAAELKALKAKIETNQSDYIDTLQQQANVRNELAALEKEQQLSASQLSSTQARLAELKAQQDGLATQTQAADEKLTAAQEQNEHAGQKLADAMGKLKAARGRLTTADNEHRQHQAQYNQTKTRHATLKEMSQDYTGFYAGVRTVLKNKSQLDGVVGAVAELLTVPEQYQAALDQALGANLQAIVTANEQAAKGAIAFLKRRRAGRATFLPADVIRPRDLPSSTHQILAGQTGFIGVASELVSYPQNVQRVMQNLMGSLIVMDNIDNAVRAAGATGHRFRIVTLDGDILNAGGSLSGGSRQHGSASPLARSQELKHLEDQLAAMTTKLQSEQEAIEQLEHEADGLNDQVQTLTQAVQAAGQAVQECEGDKRVLTEQSKQLDRQRASLQLSMPEGTVDLAAHQQELSAQAAQIATQLADLKTEGDAMHERQTALETSANSESEQAASDQAALAVAQTDLRTSELQRNQWQANANEASDEADRLSKRVAAIEDSSAVTATEKEARKQTIARLDQELADLKQQQAQMRTQQVEGKTALSRLSGRITTAYDQRQAHMTTSEAQSVALNRCKINIDNRLQTLADEYDTTYEAALAAVPTPEPDQPQLRSQIKLLKRGLDELGPVNPNAVAEYAEVKERYDFLTKQDDDLNNARTQLESTMAELDDEVRVRFKDVFEATAAAFTEIFPQMFGGGHAELKLTEPDDLLNTGIEIIAQPPGKKLTRLSLLSGGERALTAITLLFAILRVRPVPFSILDEVEASLDEANVDRFGEFLHNYSSSTQFIVITHRRGTMVAADVLYGVTMQESGVSTMVAVTLDEAVAAKSQETNK